MRTYRYLAVLVLLLFTLGVGCKEKRDRRKQRQKIFESLNLNSQQTQQLTTIRSEFSPQMKTLRAQKKQLRLKMNEAFASNANEDIIRSIHKDKQRLRIQTSDLRFEKMLSIRKILSKEQRQEFMKQRKKLKRSRRR